MNKRIGFSFGTDYIAVVETEWGATGDRTLWLHGELEPAGQALETLLVELYELDAPVDTSWMREALTRTVERLRKLE